MQADKEAVPAELQCTSELNYMHWKSRLDQRQSKAWSAGIARRPDNHPPQRKTHDGIHCDSNLQLPQRLPWHL
jgi:hypothetical protein